MKTILILALLVTTCVTFSTAENLAQSLLEILQAKKEDSEHVNNKARTSNSKGHDLDLVISMLEKKKIAEEQAKEDYALEQIEDKLSDKAKAQWWWKRSSKKGTLVHAMCRSIVGLGESDRTTYLLAIARPCKNNRAESCNTLCKNLALSPKFAQSLANPVKECAAAFQVTCDRTDVSGYRTMAASCAAQGICNIANYCCCTISV